MENILVRDNAFIVGINTKSSMGATSDEPKNAQPNAAAGESPMLMPNGMANRASAIGIMDNKNTVSGAPSVEFMASAIDCTISLIFYIISNFARLCQQICPYACVRAHFIVAANRPRARRFTKKVENLLTFTG